MRTTPRTKQLLGLWSAGWLAVFLVLGLVWLGNVWLQWPVLVVPAVWAAAAVRPRASSEGDRRR